MDVANYEIRKLDDLVYKYISKDKTITNTEISPLTVLGENYGSLMLKVDLTLEDEKNRIEQLSLVAKMIPENQFFQDLFNTQLTFKLEAAFYQTIVPTLQNFQREKGITKVIDFFPNFYGARINLNGSENVDSDGVILMENLKVSGFGILDRHVGIDLDTAKFIIKDMAEFHAIPLALKLQKPELFGKKIEPYMACFHPEPPAVNTCIFKQNLLNCLKGRENSELLMQKFEESLKYLFIVSKDIREPFATLIHRDIWVNNFMVKIKGGKVVKNKFVDFQMYSYNSPVRDLLFFMCSSIQFEVLKVNIDYFLKYYHQHFAETLRVLGSFNDDFSYDNLLKEIMHYGIQEIGHIIYLLLFVVRGKEDPEDKDNIALLNKEQVLPEIKEMAWWMIEEFEKRKWLEF